MNDMTQVIVPRSDQISGDDLISGPITIEIANVSIRPGTEQPVTISFVGDNGRPWKPCKSMARVMVALWGPDANAYIGRSLTLYRDPSVKWGGLEVGGIRILAMSDIKTAHTMALTQTKGSKKAFTVKPLVVEKAAPPPAPVADKVAAAVDAMVARMEAAPDMLEMAAITSEPAVIKQRTWLAANRPEMARRIDDAVHARLDALTPAEDETGEAFSE